jgi:hypothetical protein
MFHTRHYVAGRQTLWSSSGSTHQQLRHIILGCFIRDIEWLGDSHCGQVVSLPPMAATHHSGMFHTRHYVAGRQTLWSSSGSTHQRLRHIILECFIRDITWLGVSHCGRVVSLPTNGCDTSFWNVSYETLRGWTTATVVE